MTTEGPASAKMQEFWQWFAVNAFRFGALRPGSAEWSELNQRIEALGVDSWEVGPAPQGGSFLAISPAGSADKLKLTRKIIAAAPAMAGWMFLPAKPPKAWHRKFEWSPSRLKIDAGDWTFGIFKYEDGMVEVVLLGASLSELPRDEQIRIVDFVIESEIGEELLLDVVCGVDVEEAPTSDLARSAVPIAKLRPTIEEAGRRAR